MHKWILCFLCTNALLAVPFPEQPKGEHYALKDTPRPGQPVHRTTSVDDLPLPTQAALYSSLGNIYKLEKLLARGVDPNEGYNPACGLKQSAIQEAVANGHVPIIRLLRAYGAKSSPASPHAFPDSLWGYLFSGTEGWARDLNDAQVLSAVTASVPSRFVPRAVPNLSERVSWKENAPLASTVSAGAYYNWRKKKNMPHFICRVREQLGRIEDGQCNIVSDPLARENLFPTFEVLTFESGGAQILWETEYNDDSLFDRAFFEVKDGEKWFLTRQNTWTFSQTGNMISTYSFAYLTAAQLKKDTWARELLTAVSVGPGQSDAATGEDLNLIRAANGGNLESVKSSLSKGARVNTVHKGWSPLMFAAYHGHESVVAFLLKQGAQASYSYQGWNARLLATRMGHTETARLFPVDRSAPLNELPKLPAP